MCLLEPVGVDQICVMLLQADLVLYLGSLFSMHVYSNKIQTAGEQQCHSHTYTLLFDLASERRVLRS